MLTILKSNNLTNKDHTNHLNCSNNVFSKEMDMNDHSYSSTNYHFHPLGTTKDHSNISDYPIA